ncbi:cuticle collagen 40 [Ditylenchus destructor]|uniref:Cuticle collagen 40 n=1 Tax=Ditylenchus destructor TaxID=166010 RepID=A0AAD4MIM7_9BILA|nr:cuticle collagen 40 [Ditylenchus destructor]
MDSAAKLSDARYYYAERLKIITFFGIVISIISATATVVIIPLVYSYVQRVHSSLYPDLEICRGETDRLWREFSAIENVGHLISRLFHRVNIDLPTEMQNRKPRHAIMVRYPTSHSSAYSHPHYVAFRQPQGGGYAQSNAYVTAPPAYRQPPRYAVLPASSVPQRTNVGQCCGCSMGEPGPPGRLKWTNKKYTVLVAKVPFVY